jgi:hypothetical protein
MPREMELGDVISAVETVDSRLTDVIDGAWRDE